MQMSPYVDRLRADLRAAVAAGDPDLQRAAETIATAAAPGLRLLLLDVLTDAAGELGERLATPVTVRLEPGGEAAFAAENLPDPEPIPIDPGGELARLTLRLPGTLKEAAERTAASAGVSVNAFLTQAVQRAVDRALDRGFTPPPAPSGRPHSRVTGWARS
ncbi:MAG TPA: toxin-antitoxin system HicB family antitoxin [Mycobacteriales bacterium]